MTTTDDALNELRTAKAEYRALRTSEDEAVSAANEAGVAANEARLRVERANTALHHALADERDEANEVEAAPEVIEPEAPAVEAPAAEVDPDVPAAPVE